MNGREEKGIEIFDERKERERNRDLRRTEGKRKDKRGESEEEDRKGIARSEWIRKGRLSSG